MTRQEKRVKLAVLLLFAFGLVTLGLQVKRQIKKIRKQEPNPAWEQSLSLLRDRLASRDVVGYVSDETDPERPNPNASYFIQGKQFDLFALQNEVAPVILAPGIERSPIVGRFRDSKKGAALCEALGLTIEADLGEGLLLLKRSR